jgi:hypothetical protein
MGRRWIGSWSKVSGFCFLAVVVVLETGASARDAMLCHWVSLSFCGVAWSLVADLCMMVWSFEVFWDSQLLQQQTRSECMIVGGNLDLRCITDQSKIRPCTGLETSVCRVVQEILRVNWSPLL